MCLSFDDQWLYDNLANWVAADAIFNAYGWKATFAIATPSTNTTNEQDIASITSAKPNLDILVCGGT